MINILHKLDYLILTTTLECRHHAHFTDEEIDPNVKFLANGHTDVAQDGVRIRT